MIKCVKERNKMTFASTHAHVTKNIVPIGEWALRNWLKKHKVKKLKPRFVFSQTAEHKANALLYGQLHYNETWVDAIHADEVWFYMYDLKGHYLILPELLIHDFVDTEMINFATKSRGNIQKIMYLVVIARPRAKYNFDGKIGCYPVVEWRQAARDSKYRRKGTWEMHSVSMDAPMYQQMIRDLVAPAIVEKMDWISKRGLRTLRFFDDNASSHVKRGMLVRLQALFQVEIVNKMRGVKQMIRGDQHARMPNVNACDLGVNRKLGNGISKMHKRTLGLYAHTPLICMPQKH